MKALRFDAICGMALLLVCVTNPANAVDYPEVEPNNTKFTPYVVPAPLNDGDSVSGVTTGVTTTSGITTQDNFLIRTANAPLGVYRHRLQLSSTTLSQNSWIRGLTQTGGVINSSTDTTAQTAFGNNNPNLPARTVQWYGFGKGEQIYYRVGGNVNSTATYTATLSTIPVEPVVATNSFTPGPITITRASAQEFVDYDIWVYDSQLNAIPLYGRDQPEPVVLTRDYAAGTYHVALTGWNLANNQPQPPDTGESLNNAVLDFPDAALTSSQLFFSDVSVMIDDGVTFETVVAIKSSWFDIVWLQFTVGTPGGCPCAGDMDGNDVLNGLDVRGFVDALIAATGACADTNGDTMVNDADVTPFVTSLLDGDACP